MIDWPTQNPCAADVLPPMTLLVELLKDTVLAGYAPGLEVAVKLVAEAGGLIVTGKVKVVKLGTAPGSPE